MLNLLRSTEPSSAAAQLGLKEINQLRRNDHVYEILNECYSHFPKLSKRLILNVISFSQKYLKSEQL